MIADWRVKFNSPKLPFYFVVLAPCTGNKWCDDFVNVRNAQLSALQLPQTGYAVAVDLGDVGSPARSVHPRRKQEVGRRLALQALDMQYGQKVVSTGPVFAAVSAEDSASVKVSYTSGTADGLHAAGTGDCNVVGSKLCCGESPFEVMDSNSKWVRSNFTISGSTISLQVCGLCF
jgi:sialate O-acetylesterase